MKYKTYGDNNKEFANGSTAEMLTCYDPISARSVNRPMINLYENQEETYKLLNTLLKSVYGNTNNVIVPDVYEEFAPENFVINSFKNDATKFYLRIPTGMMFLSDAKNEVNGDKFGNPFSKYGEYDYKDTTTREKYTKDKDFSFVYNNRPNINLLERQLSNFIALDLTDLTNDIKINSEILPMMYPISIVDATTKLQRIGPDGNLMYVTDNNGNYLYICDNPEDAMYYLEDVKKEIKPMKYNFKTQGDNSSHYGSTFMQEDLENYYFETGISGQTINLKTDKPSGSKYVCLTSDFKKAKKVLDGNGNVKKTIGYYMEITRATTQEDEVTYLPNKKENAYWKVCLPEKGSRLDHNRDKEYDYTVTLSDENGNKIRTWEFFFFDFATEENVNNMLFNKLLVEADDLFSLSKYQFRKNGHIKHGVKISCKSESINCNNYRLKIEYSLNKGPKSVCEVIEEDDVPVSWGGYIDNVLPSKAHRQKYYNNIFELVNSFLGKFSSYQVSITNIYSYLAGETIVKYTDSDSLSIYYDLNADELNNKEKFQYDKTGKIFVSTSNGLDKNNSNLIKLYDLEIQVSSGASLAPKIKSVTSYIKHLDRKKIGTKRAEFNSLLSDQRTELKNYINIQDFDGNRNFEITEDATESNNEQTRIKSPIMRISTDNSIKSTPIIETLDGDKKPLEPEEPWTDQNNGDTPSDFKDSYISRDFITNKETHNYHTYKDMGFVIDKNKGILLYNNLDGETTGNHNAYSNYKPIEIISSTGNINILNTSNPKARIGIKNLEDSKTNIIDNLGITRIRSKQDHQLVVRKIGKQDDNQTDGASIAFIQGTSTPNTNVNAYSDTKTNEKSPEDIFVGSLSFGSGTDDEKSSNVTEKNRKISLKLAETGSLSDASPALEIRNAHSGNYKKVATVFGDIVPNNENKSLGFPINSRTYYNTTSRIPYEKDETLKIEYEKGTSTELINKEDRWLSVFAKHGYYGDITLSDRKEDIKNDDSRTGALRMGNSNIYDVSSIYINCDRTDGIRSRTNYQTINFDNAYDKTNKKENTIFSNGDEKGVISSGVILDRTMGVKPSFDPESEEAGSTGYNVLNMSLLGSTFGKTLIAKRQMFINNHKEATSEDNNVLSVKGQSIINGELILGKGFEDEIQIDNYSTAEGFNRNKDLDHPNKKYNYEYVNDNDKVKNDTTLYTFRNYGRSYFEGDITLGEKSKFTDNMVFDKKITITNNARNGQSFDDKVAKKECKYYSNDRSSKDYDTSEGASNTTISRHHEALNVVNGLVNFGTENADADVYEYKDYDSSDLKLYGSQWIKRRLEIGTSKETTLFDTFMNPGKLIADGIAKDKDTGEVIKVEESPSLFVKGATAFEGDVVFGGTLGTGEKDGYAYRFIKNHRIASEEATPEGQLIDAPSKVIFWGGNSIIDDYNSSIKFSDFDFHGSTWFDNAVRIGCWDDPEDGDTGSADSLNKNGRLVIKGDSESLSEKGFDHWIKHQASASIYGTLAVKNKGNNEINGLRAHIGMSDVADQDFTDIYMNARPGSYLEYPGEMKVLASKSLEMAITDNNSITIDENGIKNVSKGNEILSKTNNIEMSFKERPEPTEEIPDPADDPEAKLSVNKTTYMDMKGEYIDISTGDNYVKLEANKTEIQSSKANNITLDEIDGISITSFRENRINGKTTITVGENTEAVLDKDSTSLTSKVTTITGKVHIDAGDNSFDFAPESLDIKAPTNITGSTIITTSAYEKFKLNQEEFVAESTNGNFNVSKGKITIGNSGSGTALLADGDVDAGLRPGSIKMASNAAICGIVGTATDRRTIYSDKIYCNGIDSESNIEAPSLNIVSDGVTKVTLNSQGAKLDRSCKLYVGNTYIDGISGNVSLASSGHFDGNVGSDGGSNHAVYCTKLVLDNWELDFYD